MAVRTDERPAMESVLIDEARLNASLGRAVGDVGRFGRRATKGAWPALPDGHGGIVPRRKEVTMHDHPLGFAEAGRARIVRDAADEART